MATPTSNEPKVLGAPAFLNDTLSTLGTAPAAPELGVRLSSLALTHVGLRDFDQVWDHDISGAPPADWNDETTDAASAATADVTILRTDAFTQGDEFYVGSTSVFGHVLFILSTLAAGLTLVAEYWNGGWVALTITDGTSDLSASGTVSFTPPSDWVTNVVNGSPSLYYVRFTTSADPGTAPVGTQVRAGTQESKYTRVHHVPSGGAAVPSNRIISDLKIPTDGAPVVLDLGGVIMDPSDTIQALAEAGGTIMAALYGIEMDV